MRIKLIIDDVWSECVAILIIGVIIAVSVLISLGGWPA